MQCEKIEWKYLPGWLVTKYVSVQCEKIECLNSFHMNGVVIGFIGQSDALKCCSSTGCPFNDDGGRVELFYDDGGRVELFNDRGL